MATDRSKDIRDIDSFDALTNLQALVVDDLKKLGVKIPHRRDLSCMRASSSEIQKVQHFKNYLGYVPCYYLEQFGHVPSFLVRAAAILEQNLFVEGIFRKSGSLSRQKKVEEEIENECDVSSANVFDITSLIKQFFRELREPLLTNFYHDSFIKCLQIWNSTNNNNGNDLVTSEECPVLKLCLLLPPEHLSTLRFTMNMFSKIAAASDQNKMNVRNLALVMAPSIMHTCNKGDKVTGMDEKLLPLQMLLLEVLISSEKSLGLVSADLYERVETMTACFGNVLEPDHANPKISGGGGHKKKERRSGSLQGFVSTIAQSITRWHRNGSNNNSRSSLTQSSPDLPQVPEPFPAGDNENKPPVQLTPVILGKRKAPREAASALGLSATKRKAGIIGQQAVLPNTPSRKTNSKSKDVFKQNDLKANIFHHTPSSRIKPLSSKKTKKKPFFQVLCSSKNSKKIEELKEMATEPKEAKIQEYSLRKELAGDSKNIRRRKRSASPFRRFMKKKKSENLVACLSPVCPAKEKSDRVTRRSSTASCYSPHPTTVASRPRGYTHVKTASNDNPPKTKVAQNDYDISLGDKECFATNKKSIENSINSSMIAENDENTDSDHSDGFSTISGGTVIFVGDVEKKSSTDNRSRFSAREEKISTGLNKYNLKSCQHVPLDKSLKGSKTAEKRRSSLQSLPYKTDTKNTQSKKRSYSSTDAKITHRPTAIANLKVTRETKKILQRAQVPDQLLIQSGRIMYCSSPDQKTISRTTSVNSSLRPKLKASPVGHRSALVCDQPSEAPKQKNFSPAVSKADVLLRHFNSTENTSAGNKRPNAEGSSASPQWSRYTDANGQPCLYKNPNGVDGLSSPTPTKCPRLRRVSSPLSIHKTEQRVEVAGVLGPTSNRRQTEYKQMIKACLNSPNLYKGAVLRENLGDTRRKSPSVPKKRHRSLDGISYSDVATIRQKFVLKELEKRQQHGNGIVTPKKSSEPFPKTPILTLGKENSVFLSPAPILRYRKEQLPMAKVNLETDPTSRQVLQDCNKGNQPSFQNSIIKTPTSDKRSIRIKPALVPTPVKQKLPILDHKANTPIKAIHRPIRLYTKCDSEV